MYWQFFFLSFFFNIPTSLPTKVPALHIRRKDNLPLTSTLRTGRSTVRLPERKKRFFTFTKRHGQLWSLTSFHSFPGVKRAKRKVDNSPPSDADVKNEWSYNSMPPYSFTTYTRTPSRAIKFEKYAMFWNKKLCREQDYSGFLDQNFQKNIGYT